MLGPNEYKLILLVDQTKIFYLFAGTTETQYYSSDNRTSY